MRWLFFFVSVYNEQAKIKRMWACYAFVFAVNDSNVYNMCTTDTLLSNIRYCKSPAQARRRLTADIVHVYM